MLATLSGSAVIDNITINQSTISSSSNADINIIPSGTGNVIAGGLRINGTTISSDDSSAIKINETLHVNVLKSDDSSAIQIEDDLNITGNLKADAIVGSISLTGTSGSPVTTNQTVDTSGGRFFEVYINAALTVNFTNPQPGTMKRICIINTGTTARIITLQIDGGGVGTVTIGDGSTADTSSLLEMYKFLNVGFIAELAQVT